MTWSKDVTSQAPLVVYAAPAEVLPIVSVTYDPAGASWSIQYAYLTGPGETVEDVEAAMGL